MCILYYIIILYSICLLFPAPTGSGDAFGELALINSSCIRNASIVADEATDLVIVSRELFNRSLGAAQAAEFEERNSFVQGHPFFRNWSPRTKRQLAMSIRKEAFQFDQQMIRQGGEVEYLYFVTRYACLAWTLSNENRSGIYYYYFFYSLMSKRTVKTIQV